MGILKVTSLRFCWLEFLTGMCFLMLLLLPQVLSLSLNLPRCQRYAHIKVCGFDGKGWENACARISATWLENEHRDYCFGECPCKKENESCRRVEDADMEEPIVCGTDGKHYFSARIAECFKVKVACEAKEKAAELNDPPENCECKDKITIEEPNLLRNKYFV